MRFGSNVSQAVQRMLNGCTDVDPQVHGMTTDEERAAAKLPQVGDRVKAWRRGQKYEGTGRGKRSSIRRGGEGGSQAVAGGLVTE